MTVAQRLSHARTSTTLNVYAHSVPGSDRKAAELLAVIIEASREGVTRADGSANEAASDQPDSKD